MNPNELPSLEDKKDAYRRAAITLNSWENNVLLIEEDIRQTKAILATKKAELAELKSLIKSERACVKKLERACGGLDDGPR